MPELTPKEYERELVEAWVLNEWGEERPDVVDAMIQPIPDRIITPDHLVAYSAYLAKIRAGEKTCWERIDGEYIIRTATEADVIKIIGRLNRVYSVFDDVTFSIDGIMNHTHNPTDGLPYKQKQEVLDVDE